MIPKIPNQRLKAVRVGKPFNELLAYIEENEERLLQPSPGVDLVFSDLLDYTTNPTDKLTNVSKCLALRTHGVASLRTAALEMNAVSVQNHRCQDPVFHFLLSWPEHEHPPSAAIFDAAEHAINALGLGEHQYVIAIHGNTDNRHCHIAINRIHPVTYKSRNIQWAKKTLHYAARESEIKHGWTHDNGIYLVEVDRHGHKSIVLNPALGTGRRQSHADLADRESSQPIWHDPDSLESWLKHIVSRSLKRTLPKLQNWHGLHAFLDQHGILLTDTGGGGMRLTITSQDTGEILDFPASKGLRLLKRSDLEKRWGPFTPSIDTPCIVPDFGDLSQQELARGAQILLNRTLDPRTAHDSILHLAEHRAKIATERQRGPQERPTGYMSGQRGNREEFPVDTPPNVLGDSRPGSDHDRQPNGPDENGSQSLRTPHRSEAQRQRRDEERAAARADLRQRYHQYKSLIGQSDPQHTATLKTLQTERRTARAALSKESNAAKLSARKRFPNEISAILESIVDIDAETERRTRQINERYHQKVTELRAKRPPPAVWREWLFEQSKLGDQAAISALRGIVYQAQRDTKRVAPATPDDLDEERATRDAEYREKQHQKVLARLLDEERSETAIRSARINAMRPHELDALLIRYAGLQWRVTGNGNIEYSDAIGTHLFTDRGNRLTFDRQRVSDQEIKLALLHAQQKFGKQITLTGDDPIFSARMARLADDMGLTVLNPTLQKVITEHRVQRQSPQRRSHHVPTVPAVDMPLSSAVTEASPQPQALPNVAPVSAPEVRVDDSLRAKVSTIESRTTFIQPNLAGNYPGNETAEQWLSNHPKWTERKDAPLKSSGSVIYVEPGGRWIQKLGRGGAVAIRQPVDGLVHIGDVVEIDKSGKTKTISHGVGKGRGD